WNRTTPDPRMPQVVGRTRGGRAPRGSAGAACPPTPPTPPYCAYHIFPNEPYINLPYLIDAGMKCAEDAVNPAPGGNNDGWSIVGGAEYAGTITDPFGDGWFDPGDSLSGGEIGDKCAGIAAGANGGPFNLTLSTGTFAVESLWTHASLNRGRIGCVAPGAIQDSVSIGSPGAQTSPVGVSVNLPVQGSSAAGNPLTWSAIGLPAGLNINASTGAITGTPTTVAVYTPTITARDVTGAHRAVAYNGTVKPARAGARKGVHG